MNRNDYAFGFDPYSSFESKKIITEVTKGQLISKCPYETSVWTKYQRKYFCPGSLLATSRLTQKESLCSVCKKIDFVL